MEWTTLPEDWPSIEGRWRAFRHDLHQHPELGFEEHRTQAKVRAALEGMGYAPKVSAETGLIADLHPDRDAETPVALRADLDALPMPEHTPLPYRSVHDGKAHKCGHDGHTSILLAVAERLAAARDQIPVNVRLLFQPAEEGVRGGGAKVMVAEGALDGVAAVYGLHNWPGFPKGQVLVQPGPMMAETHTIELVLRGKGGHGSQPQICRDPIVAGAHVVTALQTVVSRGLGYQGGAVVSICSFQSGQADNVIPGSARLLGTIRSFEPAVTERVVARVREVITHVAAAHGTEAELSLRPGYPVVQNDPGCAARVARVAETVVGAEQVSRAGLPLAGGEDFAYMTQAVPGAYFLLGAQRPGEDTPVCHHPDFDFDDDLIAVGTKMFLGIVADHIRAPTD